MEKLPIQEVRKIYEVTSDIHNNRPHRGQAPYHKVNRLLQAGWVLLDIHRRIYRPDDSQEDYAGTVYILGHTSPDAPTEIPKE